MSGCNVRRKGFFEFSPFFVLVALLAGLAGCAGKTAIRADDLSGLGKVVESRGMVENSGRIKTGKHALLFSIRPNPASKVNLLRLIRGVQAKNKEEVDLFFLLDQPKTEVLLVRNNERESSLKILKALDPLLELVNGFFDCDPWDKESGEECRRKKERERAEWERNRKRGFSAVGVYDLSGVRTERDADRFLALLNAAVLVKFSLGADIEVGLGRGSGSKPEQTGQGDQGHAHGHGPEK